MKRSAFLPVIAAVTATVIPLAGCTSEPGYILSRPSLNEQDRALLTSTHDAVVQAKTAADDASTAAKSAHEAADKAQANATKAAADAAKADGDAMGVSAKIDKMVQEDEGK